MSMPKITIHTAAYNRAYVLGRVYRSLLTQTCKDFEWIITDDGSTDETEQLVRSWKSSDNGFPILYDKIPHGGLPRALNSGVNRANTDWFMKLDSDDYILPETVEFICNKLEETDYSTEFVGIGFFRCHPDGTLMKKQQPRFEKDKDYIDATNIQRKDYCLDMDMVEVTRISLLKKYPFQVWENELFAPEQLNYNEIALAGYKYRWYNIKLYVCDYLPDGLTKDDHIVKNNPMGFAMMHNQNMLLTGSFKEKCRCAMQMTALSICGGFPLYIKKSNCIPATILTLPLGIVLSVRRKRQFAAMDRR